MAEQDDVAIKVQDTKKIDVDKIDLGSSQARQVGVTKGLDIFAEQIRKVGLIQPVVVFPVGDRYELIVGQRRFLAHKDVLKWTKIMAMIIEKPKDDMMATTISWLENEARQKMSNKDMMRHVANYYAQNTSVKEIAEILSIKPKQVKACIALPRVPEVVRKAVESGELDAHVAIKATDAKRFEKGDTPEAKGDDVLDLAKRMQLNKISDVAANNIIEFGEENPDADNETLMTDGIKKSYESLSIDLNSSEMKRLESFAKVNAFKSKGEAAASLILDGLDQSGD